MAVTDHAERAYRELKARDPQRFQRCVQTASVIAMNHGLGPAAAAAVESALVDLADELTYPIPF